MNVKRISIFVFGIVLIVALAFYVGTRELPPPLKSILIKHSSPEDYFVVTLASNQDGELYWVARGIKVSEQAFLTYLETLKTNEIKSIMIKSMENVPVCFLKKTITLLKENDFETINLWGDIIGNFTQESTNTLLLSPEETVDGNRVD